MDDNMTGPKYFGGIEGGGTKFVCMVASGPNDIVEEVRFATTTPSETLDRAIAFFEPFVRQGKLGAIGLASFGPVDLHSDSPTFGSITTTPKPGWAHTDMIGKMRNTFDIPIMFEMDVNAAVFGEYYWVPENRQRDPLVYFTIGTPDILAVSREVEPSSFAWLHQVPMIFWRKCVSLQRPPARRLTGRSLFLSHLCARESWEQSGWRRSVQLICTLIRQPLVRSPPPQNQAGRTPI